jgi:periplasmic protein TonB
VSVSTLAEPGPVHAPGAGLAPGDPLAPVLDLGRREVRIGLVLGLMGALLLHGACVVWGLVSLFDLGGFAQDVKASVDEQLRATLDIQVVRTPPPPPAPAAPVPETPTPPPPPPEPKATTPHSTAPVPAAAQAGKILAQQSSPLDLTGDGFITGNGDSYAGGVTSSAGTSKTAVTNPNARGAGSPGTPAAPQAAAPARDLSRSAAPTTRNWNCGFPPEADRDEVNSATVTLVVTVGANGRARSVAVLSDPGHGFGRQARQCAFGMSYQPGLDRDGRAVAKTTPPFTVHFNR